MGVGIGLVLGVQLGWYKVCTVGMGIEDLLSRVKIQRFVYKAFAI